MQTVTTNEMAVLRAIKSSEYGDGGLEATWTFSVWDNIDRSIVPSRRSLGGIIGSLVSKGLVIEGGSGRDATIKMTREGLELVS